ncbi:hypothetical protein A6R68_04151, partial [Neotoma lepida]
ETAWEGQLLDFSSVSMARYSLVLPFSCSYSDWLPLLLMERGWRLSEKTMLMQRPPSEVGSPDMVQKPWILNPDPESPFPACFPWAWGASHPRMPQNMMDSPGTFKGFSICERALCLHASTKGVLLGSLSGQVVHMHSFIGGLEFLNQNLGVELNEYRGKEGDSTPQVATKRLPTPSSPCCPPDCEAGAVLCLMLNIWNYLLQYFNIYYIDFALNAFLATVLIFLHLLSCKMQEATVSTTEALLHNMGIWALEAHQADGIRTHEVVICHCFGLSLEEPKDCLSFATSWLVASSGFTYEVILGPGHKIGALHRDL